MVRDLGAPSCSYRGPTPVVLLLGTYRAGLSGDGQLHRASKFKADKKTEYAGKKDLGLGDFEPGQPVKVIYMASNNIAIELRMRRVAR